MLNRTFQTHWWAPDQHNEENMDTRFDQEEMKQAINKFMHWLEKQEKRASRTWPQFCHSCPSLSQLPKPVKPA